jgi:hypothetical protein
MSSSREFEDHENDLVPQRKTIGMIITREKNKCNSMMQAWQSFKAQQCREAQGAGVHTHLLSPYKDSNKENQIQLSKYPTHSQALRTSKLVTSCTAIFQPCGVEGWEGKGGKKENIGGHDEEGIGEGGRVRHDLM